MHVCVCVWVLQVREGNFIFLIGILTGKLCVCVCEGVHDFVHEFVCESVCVCVCVTSKGRQLYLFYQNSYLQL